MPIALDAHVHLYPCHCPQQLINHAFKALPGPTIALLLTERVTESRFAALATSAEASTDHVVTRCDDTLLEIFETISSRTLVVFAGRQFVSSEGLELHSLLSPAIIPEKLPLLELIAKVRECGGVPALPFSPGKWLGRRSEILRQVISQEDPTKLLLSDSRLRPWLWPYPRMLRFATAKNFRILRGSDPLPFKGEEAAVGTFATEIQGEIKSPITARELQQALFTNSYNALGSRPFVSWRWLQTVLAR